MPNKENRFCGVCGKDVYTTPLGCCPECGADLRTAGSINGDDEEEQKND